MCKLHEWCDLGTKFRFTLVLVQDEPLLANPYYNGKTYQAHPHMPALARVCQQARREAISIFYGADTFVFEQMAAAAAAKLWYQTLCRHISNAGQYLTSITLNSRFRHEDVGNKAGS